MSEQESSAFGSGNLIKVIALGVVLGVVAGLVSVWLAISPIVTTLVAAGTTGLIVALLYKPRQEESDPL